MLRDGPRISSRTKTTNVLLVCVSISGLGGGPLAPLIKSGQVALPETMRLSHNESQEERGQGN